jgi:hypothetical protein
MTGKAWFRGGRGISYHVASDSGVRTIIPASGFFFGEAEGRFGSLSIHLTIGLEAYMSFGGTSKRDYWLSAQTSSLASIIAMVPGAAQAAISSSETGSQTTALASGIETGTCSLPAGLAFLSGLAWPLLGLLIVLLVAFNSRVGRLFGLLPKFVHKIRGPGGIEIEINADAAKEVRANFKASYKEFVTLAKDEYDRMADARSISELLGTVVLSALPDILRKNGINYEPNDVRATIHVDDIVFRSYLYQLVDYFPPGRSDGGAGRRFSQRYGIIGQSWRLNESLGRGMAVSGMGGPSPAPSDRERAIKELVARWGMTEEEARRASRPATLSVMLRYDGQRRGLLYIDCVRENAFGPDRRQDDSSGAAQVGGSAKDVACALETHTATVRLSRAVADVLEPLRLAAPLLEIGQ